MAKKKETRVYEFNGDKTFNAFLKQTNVMADAKTVLELRRIAADERIMAIYHRDGLLAQDRPENFVIQTDEGTIATELKKKRNNQPLSRDAVAFLQDNQIKYNVEKTAFDFVINPVVKERLMNDPALYATLVEMVDETGEPLIKFIDQEEINVVADETIGQIYKWASESEVDIHIDDLTTIINRYSTLAITPKFAGEPNAVLYPTRYEALDASGEVYEHYKGGIYRLLSRFERDGVMWVEYEHLWPHPHEKYERTQDEFYEQVEVKGQLVDRFTYIKG